MKFHGIMGEYPWKTYEIYKEAFLGAGLFAAAAAAAGAVTAAAAAPPAAGPQGQDQPEGEAGQDETFQHVRLLRE